LVYLSVLALGFVVETFSFATRGIAVVELSFLVTTLRRGASRKNRQWETHSSNRQIPIDNIIKRFEIDPYKVDEDGDSALDDWPAATIPLFSPEHPCVHGTPNLKLAFIEEFLPCEVLQLLYILALL
jgi:hypothetical protein